MSAAFDFLCTRVREANGPLHTEDEIEAILGGVRFVYEGMLKKGYSDRTAVGSAGDYYREQVKVGWAKITKDGQHRGGSVADGS